MRTIKRAIIVALCALGVGATPALATYNYTSAQVQTAKKYATYQCLHYTGCTQLAGDGVIAEYYYFYNGGHHWTTHWKFHFDSTYCGRMVFEVAVTDQLGGYTRNLTGQCGYWDQTF